MKEQKEQKDVIESYKDKKIKIFLKNGSIFGGRIVDTFDSFFTLTDKYDELVTIGYNNISLVKIDEVRR